MEEDCSGSVRRATFVFGDVVARYRFAVAALLVLVHVALLVGLAHRVGVTADERRYVGAGRAIVIDWEWATTSERLHGPLPLLAAQSYLGELDVEPWNPVAFAARLGMLPFAILLLVVLGLWAWEVWGWRGGLLAMFLAAFEPTLLGHASLVTADVSLTATTILSFWLLWRWMCRPSPARLVAWGVALGLCLATKYTALLLAAFVPLIVLLALACGVDVTPLPWRRGHATAARRFAWGAAQLLVASAVTLVVLHATYLFRAPCYDPAQHGQLASEVLGRVPGAEYLFRLLPAPLVWGADFQAAASRTFGGSFLDYRAPHWAYYVASFGTKVSLPVLLLFLLAFLPRSGTDPRLGRFGLCVGVPGALLLVYLSLFNHLQNGIRYALPALPLLILWAGGVTGTRWWRVGAGWMVTMALCGWMLVATTMAWPHYLGYFNEAVGGSGRAYRLFTDSNCDWSQNQDEGRAVLGERYPGVEFLKPESGPRFGTLAAYVSDFRNRDLEREGRTYHWLRRFEAIDHYSAAWFVFRIDAADFEAAVRDGDSRAARDLARAWLWAEDAVRARAALEAADEGERTRNLHGIVDLLELVERGRASRAQVREAYLRLWQGGYDDLALRLARSPASRLGFEELVAALFRGGEQGEAIRLLQVRAGEGPLTAGQAMMLAGLLHAESPGDPAALEVLENNPTPKPGDPLANLYRRVRALVEHAAAERRRLLELAR